MARTNATNTFVNPKEWTSEDKLILLEGWARDGYKFADVAKRIGISSKQLIKWRDEYPEINEALRKGREVVDYKVESALLKAALGYRTREVTIISVLQKGQLVEVEKQVVEKDISPSVPACQTWLYNRMPHKWKNMNSRANILSDLQDDDSNISITITRAGSSPKDSVDEEWESEVNKGVTLRKKTKEEKKKERAEAAEKRKTKKESSEWEDVLDEEENLGGNDGPTIKRRHGKSKPENQRDLDYWPDDWQDD